jgi:hypothetical protein
MQEIPFRVWFSSLTGHDAPRHWQESLAVEAACRDRVIRIPTGLGNTEQCWLSRPALRRATWATTRPSRRSLAGTVTGTAHASMQRRGRSSTQT